MIRPHRMVRVSLICVLITWMALPVVAQRSLNEIEIQTFDSLTHSAKRAALRSTLVPGWGQAYNEKYWKIPLLYAGLGSSIYFIADNQMQYRNFKDAYLLRTDNDSTTIDAFPQYTTENLVTLIDFHRRNRDFSGVITLFIYALNILDATVDAHLYGFDVSEDLSFRMQPIGIPDPNSAGYGITASLTLKF